MEKLNIKQALLSKEQKFWVKINSFLLRLKNLVDKRLQIIYNNLISLENKSNKDT
jgi:hypothetical protein